MEAAFCECSSLFRCSALTEFRFFSLTEWRARRPDRLTLYTRDHHIYPLSLSTDTSSRVRLSSHRHIFLCSESHISRAPSQPFHIPLHSHKWTL
jgi:hypothetical protein